MKPNPIIDPRVLSTEKLETVRDFYQDIIDRDDKDEAMEVVQQIVIDATNYIAERKAKS